jgi:RNA recognition motif-containing protein
MKAFSRYPSVTKARVVREKRTTKSKGYGFVAFSNTDDFFAAAKEMQGKYIGSHPVIVKRATTEIVATTQADKKRGKNGKESKKGGGAGAAGKPAGIQKWHQHKKDKSGPKMLG